VLLWVGIFASCVPRVSGRFYYPNFLDVTALRLKGSTKKHGQCLLLTGFSPNEAGAVWYKKKLELSSGFFTAFNFRIKPPGTPWKESRGLRKIVEGGEGIAFVFHKGEMDAVGGKRGGLGYEGLEHAIAIEFDTVQNSPKNDPNSNHVSLHFPNYGEGGNKADAFEHDLGLVRTDVPPLGSGEMQTVQVSYDGENIKVYLNDLVNPIIQHKAELKGEYWMGFTASTGISEDLSSQHRVCDWYFETDSTKDRCDTGFVGSGCALDSAPSVPQCLAQSSCYKCLNHIRDCRWCSSQKRCVAGAVSSDMDSELDLSFCDDPMSLISNEQECVYQTHDFASLWNNFMALLISLFIFSVFGRIISTPDPNAIRSSSSSSSSSKSGKKKCFRNNFKMWQLFSLLESTCAGSIFAVIISYMVNYSLFLLTTYTLYSIGLGFLFIVVGSLILWQGLSQYFDTEAYAYGNPIATREGFERVSSCILLCAFALYLTACGVICFMLEGDFARNMTPTVRVLVYACIGISMCFSMVFVSVDLATRISNICRKPHTQQKPLAENGTYVKLLAVSACISGLYFGYMFGMIELENFNKSHVALALMQQNYYCYPLGCFLGGLTALINRFLTLPDRFDRDIKHMRRMDDGL